jgi:ribosomal protein S14
VARKIIAILLVAPVALLGFAAIRYDSLGLNQYLGFAPDLAVQIGLGTVALLLLALANHLWSATPAKAAQPEKPAEAERPCPHCGGLVRTGAALCRHCLENLHPFG